MGKYQGPLKIAVTFLIPGLLFGLIFGWLTRWGTMTDFFYIRGDKFLFPTYRYWLGGTLSFNLAIWTGYSLARLTGSQGAVRSIPAARLFGAVLLMVATAPVLAFIHDAFGLGPSFFWDILLLPVATIGMIPIGLKLYTTRWESLLTVMMIVAVLLSVFGGYAIARLIQSPEPPRDLLPIIQMSIEEGLISALAGIWLIADPVVRRDHNPDDKD